MSDGINMHAHMFVSSQKRSWWITMDNGTLEVKQLMHCKVDLYL